MAASHALHASPRARVFIVPSTEIALVQASKSMGEDENDDQYISHLQPWIDQHLGQVPWNQMRRGDVIKMEWMEYRNDGLFFWTGHHVISPNYDVDEYGSVPEEFAFPEFDIHYYQDIIAHNFIVNIDPQFMRAVKQHAVFKNARDFNVLGHQVIIYSWFKTNQGQRIHVIGICEDVDVSRKDFMAQFKNPETSFEIAFEGETTQVRGYPSVVFRICCR